MPTRTPHSEFLIFQKQLRKGPSKAKSLLRQGAEVFEEAQYSSHELQETQRQQIRELLNETEETLTARADWKQKLRLKYREWLWI